MNINVIKWVLSLIFNKISISNFNLTYIIHKNSVNCISFNIDDTIRDFMGYYSSTYGGGTITLVVSSVPSYDITIDEDKILVQYSGITDVIVISEIVYKLFLTRNIEGLLPEISEIIGNTLLQI
jgi:hypothetical protein